MQAAIPLTDMDRRKKEQPAYDYSVVDGSTSSAKWRGGFLRRFPWLGAIALLIAILSLGGMILVLVLSNNKPISDWSVQPSVYLSIIATIGNIAIAFALTEATTIAWWVKAIKPDTRISDLHNIWAFSASLQSALCSGWSFNFVALACIAVTISRVNGPLLQRASTVESFAFPMKNVNLTLPLAQDLPTGYTGIVTGHGYVVTLATSNFSSVINDHNNAVPIVIPNSGCKGKCAGSVEALGFAINCSTKSVPFVAGPRLNSNGSLASSSYTALTIFSTSWSQDQVNSFGGEPLALSAIHKPDSGCNGSLVQQSCTLRPALMRSRVLMENDTISLDANTTYKDDLILNVYPPVAEVISEGASSTYGGYGLVLKNTFDSAMIWSWTGATGYAASLNGSTVFQYTKSDFGIEDCNISFSDPTPDLLNAVREIAFRAAVKAADPKNSTNLVRMSDATQQQTLPVFRSHYYLLTLALVFTAIPIVATVPMFFGWWSLGRSVTLSPVEVAKAFDPPILREVGSNADIRTLLREVGSKKIN